MFNAFLKPFVIDATDIDFILAQIKFKPLFDAAGNAIINWDGVGTVYDLLGNAIVGGTLPEDAASVAALAANGSSYQSITDLSGLRDVTGLNNNLSLPLRAWGSVDQAFPRMAAADYTNYAAPLVANTPGAYAADNVYGKAYGGANGFDQGGTGPNGTIASLNTDYTITVGGSQHATDGTAITMKNVVDYTPRMISLTTTTAGVVYDTWANHQDDPAHVNHTPNEIYYGADGVATVLDWGALQTTALGGLGQVDTQARLAGSAGIGDHFVGGLNPGVSPSNGFFVLFGQFFDHGLDFIDKGAQGKTIKIAFAQNDPLYGMAGPDGRPVYEITMNRASVQTVADGSPQYADHTSPFIDQSQTYGSHEQLTTLLRKWVMDPVTGHYHAGMEMFDGHTLATTWTRPDGTVTNSTLPTLNELAQAVIDTGRDALTWEDVLNLRNRDASGHLSGGNSDSPLLLDMNPHFDTTHLHQGNATQDAAVDAALAALNDDLHSLFGSGVNIGFNADGNLAITGMPLPPGSPALVGANALFPWVNFSNFSIMQTNAIVPSAAISSGVHDAVSTLLMASVGDHYIAGDGRVNENFGLTSIHHVFHEEHNYQVGNFMDALHREAISTGSFDNLHSFQVNMSAQGGSTDPVTGDYLTSTGAVAWDLDKMFNATKLIVEMEYQHAAVDQYARNVSPNIQEFVGYSPDKNPSVTLEYAQSVFRFGHSQLRETIDTIDPTHGLTGKIMGYALRDAFLNPDKYADVGPASILLGMTHQQMNEIDEFVTPALNQGLLGQPLDLAAINIARGRDIGIPTLNDFRGALGMLQYTSWNDFGQNMEHPTSLVNFIAAYSFDGDMAKAQEIMDLVNGTIETGALTGATKAQAFAFLEGDSAGAGADLAAGTLAFNKIDTWLGGLAEVHQPGGILGETFDKVFVTQIESLMDGDRFYYLYRLAGQQFASEIGGGQLKDIVERNTGLTHLNGNIFGYADQYVDLGAKRDTTALTQAAGGTESTLTHTYGQATSLLDTHTLDATGTMLAINSGDTVGNEHKYGDIAAVDAGTMGVYSNGGRSNAFDGTLITLNTVDGNQTYIRDTRVADTNPDSLYAANSGVNLDGTPNSGAESNEVIVGTKGNDMIYAQGGDDTVYGDGGNDIIYGGYGIDRLYGGAGSDTIYGGDNPDLIDGGAGDDRLYGESSGTDINGADQIEGGSGNDYVDGGTGIDKLNGGTGDDHVVGGQDTDPFTHGGDGNDIVEGNSGGDILYGDNGDDLLIGGSDQDQMFGGNGDDIIRPGEATGAMTIGSDEVLGGDGVSDVNPDGTIGFDIIDYSDNTARTNGVTFDLSAQINPGLAVNGTPQQTPSFQIEGVIGSVSGDTLTTGGTHVGAANAIIQDNNWAIGGSGNDTLANSTAGSGNDIFIGGSIRLDDMIGRYSADIGNANYYNYNNNNAGLTAADQLQDARYQGASHRVNYAETIDNTGIIDQANKAFGSTYAKAFTDMLRSAQFKDLVLGDNQDGTKAALTGGNDTVVFNGLRSEYDIKITTVTLHDGEVVKAYYVHDKGGPSLTNPGLARPLDGNDLVIGVTNFQFADETVTEATLLNLPPVITSNGGGATAAIGLNENITTPVTTVTATDANNVLGDPYNPQQLVYSISTDLSGVNATANADYAKFTINPTTGELNFIASPNFEAPTDAGANNVYNVVVKVSDGITSDTQALAITVANVNEAPTGSIDITAATPNATSAAATITALNTLSVDPDGPVTNTVAYQWQQSVNNGVAWTNIAGATTNTLANQTAKTLRVVSTYTDAFGAQIVTSAQGAVIGTTGNDTLTSTTLNDFIVGLSGTDTAVFSAALPAETFSLNAAGQLVVTGADGIDTLSGIENVRFGGAAGAVYTLALGTNGVDTLAGTTGQDLLLGFDGNDTYTVNNAGDVVIEVSATGGTDLVNSSVNYTLGANIENLTLTGTSAINGTGNDLANTITGNTGNNVLTGGLGDDVIDGGTGTDTAVFSAALANEAFSLNASGQLVVTGADGIDKLISIENVRFGGAAGPVYTLALGTNAANTLAGTTGQDLLLGFDGNDTYTVNNAGDVVIEVSATGGTDLVNSSVTYALGANIENLTLTGTSAINGTGNSLANTITGNTGNNVLDGAGGADILVGGAGNDTYIVNNAGVTVTEALNAGTDTVQTALNSFSIDAIANVENLTFAGTGDFTGTGNTLNNTITGGAGNDTLDAGTAGTDVLVGGAGNDTYIVNHAGVTTTELAAGGIDTVRTTLASFTLGANVENLTFTGTGNFAGTGNTGSNIITGGAGNDTLDGGTAGADVLVGGLGNDTYTVSQTGTTITELSGEGTDLVNSSVTYALGANIENLTLTGTAAISGTGNALANTITGNTGNNVLTGGLGNDVINGGTGTDTAVFSGLAAEYTIAMTGGAGTVTGADGTDTLSSIETLRFGTTDYNILTSAAPATATYQEQFGTTSYTTADGAWTTSWVEVGDDGDTNTNGALTANGQIRINNTRLEFDGGSTAANSDGARIYREIDLSTAGSATVSFDWTKAGLTSTESVQVRLAYNIATYNPNDATTYQVVQTINSALGSNGTVSNFALTGAFTAHSALVFEESAVGTTGTTRLVSIDNISVVASTPNTLTGDAGNNIMMGDANGSFFNGGAGNDVIHAGAGNDTITQLSTDGHDYVDGGAGTDTYVLQGTADAETFNIYSATAWLALGAGHTAASTTGIVITRNGTTDASVVAELSNIEEIRINGSSQAGSLTDGSTGTGATSGDTVNVIGNFVGTGLAYSTITVNGAGNTVDITALTSDHRVVLNTDGGTGTIVGDVRPQDVINGSTAAAVTTVAPVAAPTLSIGDFSSTLALIGGNDPFTFLPPQQLDNAMTVDQLNLISGDTPSQAPAIDYGSIFDHMGMDMMQDLSGMESHFHHHSMSDYYLALV